MQNISKIILAGGAGFVGQNLTIALLKQGYSNIIVLDKDEANIAAMRARHPGLSINYADFVNDTGWDQHFLGAEVVVSLNAQISATSDEPFIRNNVTATEQVIAAIRKYKVPYTVHISSSVVESVASDSYTTTKRKQEQLVIESAINAVVLRPTLMFGKFNRTHFGWLFRFMQKCPVFPVPGHGKYVRQPLYVEDFCNIIIHCIGSGINGMAFNISGREKIDYIDCIRSIRSAGRVRCFIVPIPYLLFHMLLKIWALCNKNTTFTTDQLAALTTGETFEIIDWENIFQVKATPFAQAINATFGSAA